MLWSGKGETGELDSGRQKSELGLNGTDRGGLGEVYGP